jgi:hypothetical protein
MEHEEEIEDIEEPEECENPEELIGSIIDSLDAIADNCICTFEEIMKDAHTTEWTLKCDWYTLTITLTLKTPS